MKVPFTQIRNIIRRHDTNSLLKSCHEYLEKKEEQVIPLWNILLIMKWSYLHGNYNFPSKTVSFDIFRKIYNHVYDFNNEHISSFIQAGKLEQGMQIFHCQQFYLQRSLYNHIFATQLKLYSLYGNNIDKNFKLKTGLSVLTFLQITHLIWVFIESKKLSGNPLKYFGYISQLIINFLSEKHDKQDVENYFHLTVLKNENAKERIENYKRGLSNPDLQIFEPSFFTLYPFHEFNGKIKVIHKSIFKYFSNYFIYDFLKSNDIDFTTNFGKRFEKLIEISLIEIFPIVINEAEIKKKLGNNSKLIDFYLPDLNIFIECKAIEIQTYPT